MSFACAGSTRAGSALRAGVLLAALAGGAGTARAELALVELGTEAPPRSVAGVPVAPFDVASQDAIPDFTGVHEIPGNTLTGQPLLLDFDTTKLTAGDTAPAWSHGYAGPVYEDSALPARTAREGTIILPLSTRATYIYAQPAAGSKARFVTVQATTLAGKELEWRRRWDAGAGGAHGVGFASDDPDDPIVTLTVSGRSVNNVFFGEFGLAVVGVPVELESAGVE